VSERSKRISRLLESAASRASYIRAKLNVLIPSQIRALRLKQKNMTQKQLAALANMAQPRISAMERPGETKFNIETLVRLAAAFKVGLKIEFVPFSEMLEWENCFSQDEFEVTRIDGDSAFLNPVQAAQPGVAAQIGSIWDAVQNYPSSGITLFASNRFCNPPRPSGAGTQWEVGIPSNPRKPGYGDIYGEFQMVLFAEQGTTTISEQPMVEQPMVGTIMLEYLNPADWGEAGIGRTFDQPRLEA
jgi:transcriptional regulator with XRE-family HTH domain